MGNSLNVDVQSVTTVMGGPEKGGGTWFHEDVALEFARWLSIDFKLWCPYYGHLYDLLFYVYIIFDIYVKVYIYLIIIQTITIVFYPCYKQIWMIPNHISSFAVFCISSFNRINL